MRVRVRPCGSARASGPLEQVRANANAERSRYELSLARSPIVAPCSAGSRSLRAVARLRLANLDPTSARRVSGFASRALHPRSEGDRHASYRRCHSFPDPPSRAACRCRRPQGPVARQAAAALSSAALNTAEGSDQRGARRTNHYAIALGSARESLVALRAAEAWGYIAPLPPAVVNTFDHVIGTLVKNVRA